MEGPTRVLDAWQQHNIHFPDRETAQHVAVADLYPALLAAEEDGALRSWWFVRKRPWRLRYIADRPATAITDLLDKLAADGRAQGWNHGVYEPETTAFGGAEAMNIAHTLFHQDSRHILQPPTPKIGPRETTAVLCSAMLRAAGLDWYEQGDVWSKVAELRPLAPGTIAAGQRPRLTEAMHRLMSADERPLTGPRGPLANGAPWAAAFQQAGRDLRDLSHHGFLRRGLRAVLAHHVIFHANRTGLSAEEQSALAALALDAVFHPGGGAVPPPDHPQPTTRVNYVTTLSDGRPVSADQLRADLADRLCQKKVLRTPAIENAFRATPRHLFLPGLPVEEAYADNPVYTKTTADGTRISAASQPWMVAAMLEQLDIAPGHRVLEAGAGTGYNAAVMATIAGDTGHVTTIDVDDDLVAAAQKNLAAADIDNVEVLLADGALGHAEAAPYDRIIATVGAYEIPTAWLDQLAPDGRLVVPLRLRGTNSRSIIFEREDDRWVSRGSALAVFMPLRGIGDDARRIVPLTPAKDVTLQVHKDQDVDGQALDGVLTTERHEEWTGVLFPPEVPYEWMDLWLCLHLPNALMRMNATKEAAENTGLSPMFPWGTMATTSGETLAYLTTRPAPRAADGGKLYEVGVIGHGPAAKDLAGETAEHVRTWNKDYRSHSVRFEIPDTAEPATRQPDDSSWNGPTTPSPSSGSDPMDARGPIATRFPLVARPRPACLPLDCRVGKLVQLAHTTEREEDPVKASTVYNQAALLASDVGLPALARTWCHEHATAYLAQRPLPAKPAIRGLEPLVNLARLHIRAGHHDEGHALLLALYEAVSTGRGTVLDGIDVPADLTRTDGERHEVRRWLWRVVIADGTRALTSAGRWPEALRHVQKHRGIGSRMLDGRQVAVVTALSTGENGQALALLNDTAPGEPWEDAVTACLTAFSRREAGQQSAHQVLPAWGRYTALGAADGLAVFDTRLALAFLDSLESTDCQPVRDIVTELLRLTSNTCDGYAAREVLNHPTAVAHLTGSQGEQLKQIVNDCALDTGALPQTCCAGLPPALRVCRAVIERKAC
ncbi:methyltransferase, FxLD system [Streptomyces sp. DSM 42041]|uniref:Protein-L-isoaspartate O-methyltransferase n=1 Tax=Streptomyces hazeniae TaxID=3075538 RepID=A0ABU2NQC8_9ACTN|nr:methyltransferase, FxLD system [Streptomyces sp. DSM 42041]MDT0378413.1 methyltransferase, FxLD system [Streptomyces sp. DSM 42041]